MTRSRSWILAALFASGLAGLMHEVVWAKLLAQMIGSTSAAHAVVLSIFMGGLALGALILGKRSDSNQHPLRIYVVLEILIALYGIALPWIARGASRLYETIAADAFDSLGTKLGARILVAALVIAFPALCMGGTLPVLARALIRHVGDTRREVGWLYAVNNLGAVLGSGLAGFVLLPAYGLFVSLLVASGLNLLAALLAAGAPPAPAAESQAAVTSTTPEPRSYPLGTYRLTLFALLFAGFAAMGYEVVYLRIIALGLGSSAHSFTLMLMAFIGGIGVGSWIVGRLRVERPLWWLAATQLGVVVAMLATTHFAERIPYYVSMLRVAQQTNASGFEFFVAGQGFIVLAILSVPTILIGMGFPLVAQIQARSVGAIGSSVGSTYAWNTVGNVLGTVLASQWLLPTIGLEDALLVNVGVHLVAGLVLTAVAIEGRAALRLACASGTLVALLLYAALGTGWASTLNLLHDHLRLRDGPETAATPHERDTHPTTSFANFIEKHRMKLSFWTDGHYLAEDPDVTVFAGRRGKFAALYLNGKGDASTGQIDMLNQVLIGHLPLFLAPHAKRAMIIGYGSGVTAGSALTHALERLDLIEISKGVLGADPMFAKFNHGVLTDPRVRVVRDDARTILRTTTERYDLVLSQPSNPWIAGIGSLFTVEFFEEVKARLNPGGVFCYWFHQYEQSDAAVELMLRTLQQVFPHAVGFFANTFDDVIAIASTEELAPDFAAMEALFERDSVRHDLARIGVMQLSTLLAFNAFSDARLAASFPPGPLNTDDHQRIEDLGVRALFWGKDTEKMTRFEGFTPLADGTNDGMLERYAAWRAEHHAPISAQEFAPTARTIGGIFSISADHRLKVAVERRLAKSPPASTPETSLARGALAPLARMDFVEAMNQAAEREARGDREGASLLYRRALELEPGHDGPTARLAQALIDEQKLDEARALAEDSARKRPTDAAAQLLLARLYIQFGEHQRAKSIYEALIATQDNQEAFVQLAGLAEMAEDWPRATKLYERALAIMLDEDPARWVPALRLTLLYGRDGTGTPRARAMLDDALARQPQQPELLQVRKELYGF